jgi:hypothetical protein
MKRTSQHYDGALQAGEDMIATAVAVSLPSLFSPLSCC